MGSVATMRRRRRNQIILSMIAVAVLLVGVVVVTATSPWDGSGSEALTTAPAPPPVLPAPQVMAVPQGAPMPVPAVLGAALAPVIANPALGRFAGVVTDAATGTVLWGVDPDTPLTPASTAKILTSAAALLALPIDHRVSTDVVRGDAPNELVLVGRGDPTLTAQPIGAPNFYPGAARIEDLAEQVRRSGVAADTILVDTSAYSGPTMAEGWVPADIAGGFIAPIEPVMLDGGRIVPLEDESPRTPTPALDAGRALAIALGIDPANVRFGAAPAGAAPVAVVQSAPLRDRLGQMMWRSDNVLAEAIGRELAIDLAGDRTAQAGSFDGAVRAVTDTLSGAGVDLAGVRLSDVSGLSVNDLAPARALGRIVAMAAGPDETELRPMLDYLPVAGATGTLADRYAAGDRAGAGWVRAKTGTLSEASALVGSVIDVDQRVLTFALLSNGTPPVDSRPALDAVAGTLRSCGCR
ncbi:D-alanyl-D-alanine carboxypeptidase/D-alanyl-D-alanine endopeptidase [Aldersonia kunmingensis]|uniref:D-alanyl-D-alanine carboxypeptidase/D-alanyl-D-alanine endopeptidase n=1 Tax=Aldersonia kunmingensis TaxID=408066 RepID=UPI000836E6A7|nr:D-alanyl-D-alanine carboxypeptidase/D-alanyl-D-alanine-endopeptidase [Aldersonia kunmingensis]